MSRTLGAKDKKPRKMPVKAKIDWESLAKNLQQALAAEIKENDLLRKELDATHETLNLSAARNAVILKQIEFVQNMAAKLLVDSNGDD